MFFPFNSQPIQFLLLSCLVFCYGRPRFSCFFRLQWAHWSSTYFTKLYICALISSPFGAEIPWVWYVSWGSSKGCFCLCTLYLFCNRAFLLCVVKSGSGSHKVFSYQAAGGEMCMSGGGMFKLLSVFGFLCWGFILFCSHVDMAHVLLLLFLNRFIPEALSLIKTRVDKWFGLTQLNLLGYNY